MTLCKLTKSDIKSLEKKTICCVEKSITYLEEFCNKYDVLNHISYIVDTSRRSLGKFIFREKEIEVYDLPYLEQIVSDRTVVVITSDYYREAYEKIVSVLGDKVPEMTIYYFANRETKYEDYYRERYAHAALENIIIFRSGPHASSYLKGTDFADNARALFEYALKAGINHKYELIWFVKKPEEFKRYENTENVKFLSFDWSISENQAERDAYYEALCLAKYIFFTDAYGFARNCRQDQIRVQLWHGCGFKTRVNFVRCEKRYEYTTVISDLYANIHADIYGLRKDQILVTGYAKQDWLFHPEKEDIERLHIPEARKYIFWLPTFRSTENKLEQLNEYVLESETGLPIVNTKQNMDVLNAILSEKDIVLIVKLHPFQDRNTVHCEEFTNIYLIENAELAQKDIPINRLLGQADALISDYSSAAVDYMLLDRPMAFMLEDVEEYEQSRGFVFENIREWLPGKEIFYFEQLCDFVKEVADRQDLTAQKRRRLKEKMHRFNDDQSCRRILEALQINMSEV